MFLLNVLKRLIDNKIVDEVAQRIDFLKTSLVLQEKDLQWMQCMR